MTKPKPRPSLLPWRALLECAAVMTASATKHGDQPGTVPDWQTRSAEHHVDAALRHLAAELEGTRRDAETGRLHLAHGAVRLLMAAWVRLKEERDA